MALVDVETMQKSTFIIIIIIMPWSPSSNRHIQQSGLSFNASWPSPWFWCEPSLIAYI